MKKLFVYNPSMNETPSANRTHIAFFGRRNVGKSSLVNAVTGQNLAIVSDKMGTTTDPVYKAMELLPLGPVVIIDTPGFDDRGELGELRVKKAHQVLNKTDIAVLVLDNTSHKGTSNQGFAAQREDGVIEINLCSIEEELINIFIKREIPYIIALNKYDIIGETTHLPTNRQSPFPTPLPLSAKTGYNINLLKEKIAALVQTDEPEQPLVGDLVQPHNLVVLVIPIDKAAPKGRLILPQQQVIRNILDSGAVAIAVRESELRETLASLGRKPALVITDSQVFAQVSAVVPPEIPLTSFSILFARYKGFLETSVHGAAALDNLQNGDKILICEGCTHHRQCDDIGTVKIPGMIKSYTGKEPVFYFCSGGDFPDDLSPYKLIIHCGGCMLNERETRRRRCSAEEQNIPFTNYGITIAHINGLLKRSIAMLNLRETK